MATSGTYTFSSNRDAVISAAFRKIGVLGDWQSLNATLQARGLAQLNPMLKRYANLGMPLWALKTVAIPLSTWSAGPTVTIGPGATINQIDKPLKILQAVRRDNSVPTAPIDVPLNIYTYQDYWNLSQKESAGAPVHLFYHPLRDIGEISLWGVPDTYWQTNGELIIRYQRQFQDAGSATDDLDFPVEWEEALIYGLAKRLAPDYGVELNTRMTLIEEAKDALEDALAFGTEEGSLFLQPRTKR